MGMPPTANRNIAVMPVGVGAVKTLPPMPIPTIVARRFCMQAQEREPLTRPHAHGSRVSRATVSTWIKKK
jgi:hypothetical protein